MLPYTLVVLIVAVLLMIVYACFPRATPTRCRCGERAIVIDDARTHGQCYACWLKSTRM